MQYSFVDKHQYRCSSLNPSLSSEIFPLQSVTVSTGFRGTVCFIIMLIISKISLSVWKRIVKDLRVHPRSRQRFPQPKLIQLLILLLCSWTVAFKTLLILTLSFYVVTIHSCGLQLLMAGNSSAFSTVSHLKYIVSIFKIAQSIHSHEYSMVY